MTDDEEKCYGALLAASKSVIEYGVGGSTLMALHQPSVTSLVSVESDPSWIADMQDVVVVSDAIKSGIAKFIYVDIGEVGAWGRPKDHGKINQWFKYPVAPWEHVSDPDLIFVDGRFRVACIMEAVLRARPDTIIAVHDFWNRPPYHIVLPFLEWQQSCGTLGIFRTRTDGDREKAKFLLESAQLVSE